MDKLDAPPPARGSRVVAKLYTADKSAGADTAPGNRPQVRGSLRVIAGGGADGDRTRDLLTASHTERKKKRAASREVLAVPPFSVFHHFHGVHGFHPRPRIRVKARVKVARCSLGFCPVG